MSTELRLRAEGGSWPPAVVSPETFLRRLPQRACFTGYALLATASSAGLELRVATNVSGMPDVSIRLEERGFLIVDNNATLANHVLAELVRYLAGTCDRVTIEEP